MTDKSVLDHCAICGKAFVEGDPISVSDGTSGRFEIVCRECAIEAEDNDYSYKTRKKAVKKTQELNSKNKLWRYMDLAKFLSMMKDSTIFFSSPRGFDDLFEGAHGELRNKGAWDDYYLSFSKTAIITAPDNCWHKIDEKKLNEDAYRLLGEISEKKDTGIYISCWHGNEYESEAMWKMYSQNVKNAIAVQTTVGALRQQLGDKARIRKIKYIDYSERFVGINDVYWHKRKSFEYENEVRAIINDFEIDNSDGLAVQVDLQELIENIYISPYAPSWFYPLVEDLVRRYGYEIPIKKSSMIELPF